MSKRDRALCSILTTNLGLRGSETLLILCDRSHTTMAARLASIGERLCEKVKTLTVTGLRRNGQEPSRAVARAMRSCDCCVILTTYSLSHTKARRDATSRGVRLASMPGISDPILRRSVLVDYDRLKQETKILADLLDRAKEAHITTALGTDLTLDLRGRRAHGRKAGLYTRKGHWGNLPEGEAFIAPKGAEGVFVVDGSIAGIGKVNHPVIFFVDGGSITKVTNGPTPAKVERSFRLGPKSRVIAELGIGLNRRARVTGTVLEDEKAYGTCHIAFGNNIGFGGTNDVPLHIDCVISSPTISIDGKTVMRRGRLTKILR